MERTYEEAVKDIKAAIFDIVDSEKKTTLSLKKQIEEETDEDKKNELEELHKEENAKIDTILENADIIINDVEILEKINFDNNLKADELIEKIEKAKGLENEEENTDEDTIDTDEDEDEDEKEETTEGKLIEDDEEDEDEEENVEEESESEEETDEIEEDENEEENEEADEIEEENEETDEIEESDGIEEDDEEENTDEESDEIEEDENEEENTEEESEEDTDEIEENEIEEETNETEEVQEEPKSSEEPVLVVPNIAEVQEEQVENTEEESTEVSEETTEEPVEDNEVEETPVENTNDKWAFNKEDKNAPRAIMVIKTQEEKLIKSRDAQTLKVKAAGLFNDYDYNKSTANTIKGDVITKSIEEELNFAALEDLPLERQIEDLTVKLNIYNDEGEVEIANAITAKIKELKEKLNLSESETEEATTKVKAA